MIYFKQLATEAVVVGGLFVPWMVLWDTVVIKAGGSPAPLVSAFLAGASFHLVAEATGLNEWDLDNSAARLRSLGAWCSRHKSKKSKKRQCGIVWP